MILTSTQIEILRADILTHPELDAARQSGDDVVLAAYYNAQAVPDYTVWRTNVKKHEYTSQPGPTGTLFQWSTTGGYIGRSQGERDAWKEIFSADQSVNPSLVNVRAAFDDIFSGTGAGSVANRAHLTAVGKRKATVLEKLFAVGSGTDLSPSVMTVEGAITPAQISVAR